MRLPVATEVQAVTASPTLPHPFPFTLTVSDPVSIGFACFPHIGVPGIGTLCTVLTSPCLLTPIPLTNTLVDPTFVYCVVGAGQHIAAPSGDATVSTPAFRASGPAVYPSCFPIPLTLFSSL